MKYGLGDPRYVRQNRIDFLLPDAGGVQNVSRAAPFPGRKGKEPDTAYSCAKAGFGVGIRTDYGR